MGLFYTTFTTHGVDQAKILTALQKSGRTAFVSPTIDRYTVIFDRITEEQDFTEIDALGKKLSQECHCFVLAAALHDDDVLYLWLFHEGDCLDFYDSLPQYFDPVADPGPPEGGDSAGLCQAFGHIGKTNRVETLLRANLLEDELPEIIGEHERHQALLKELGIPAIAAFATYSSIEENYLPEQFKDVVFTRVGQG